MDDKADAGIAPRDWFAELTTRIPNFVGYQIKDQRRTADKVVRDTMVLKLDDLRDILSDVIEKANDAETSVVDDISKILRTMNELRDKIEFLGYGDATFFTDEHLSPDFLAKVYQLETQIYDSLDELETAFESPTDLGRRDTLRDIRKRLELISQDFAARKEILKSSR
ncbi:MAG: hypothetical protein ACYDH4_07005 [Candidatus Cryosericum sp.]